MTFRASLIVVLSLLFAGCALSPQNVILTPTITITNSITAPHVVKLSIDDRRPQKHLGTRGGVYAKSSYIYLAKPLAQSLYPAAITALQKYNLAPMAYVIGEPFVSVV